MLSKFVINSGEIVFIFLGERVMKLSILVLSSLLISSNTISGRQDLSMSLITTASPLTVIDFYEKELTQAGFNIFSKADNDKRVSVTGKHADGKDFSISNRTRTDNLSEGETEL